MPPSTRFVRCPEPGCGWTGNARAFSTHYRNAHGGWRKLQPEDYLRPEEAVWPPLGTQSEPERERSPAGTLLASDLLVTGALE